MFGYAVMQDPTCCTKAKQLLAYTVMCASKPQLLINECREARHPFLDEAYISTVLKLPLWLVADLRQPPGVGDKRLLRAALKKLGLPQAAVRVKRAIQFGTGIGKLSNIRAFGSNRAADRKNVGSLSVHLLAGSSHEERNMQSEAL